VIAQLFFGLLLFATVLGHVANIVTSVSAGRKEFQGESGSNSSRSPMAPRLPPSLPSRDGTLPAARRNCDRPSISLSLSMSVCLRACVHAAFMCIHVHRTFAPRTGSGSEKGNSDSTRGSRIRRAARFARELRLSDELLDPQRLR